jgi:hypothetical protein
MMMIDATPTSPPRPFKRLIAEEMAERRRAGLCFNCDVPFVRGHKCKHLFDITTVNDYDTDKADSGLMMMIETTHSAVRGSPPMYLTGAISRTGVHILVDTGTTHNIIDINVARIIDLLEQRIETTILVGSGTAAPCRAAFFSVPLRIDVDVFYIDTFLLDIGNDIDIVLGTPWLASLGCPTWDFTTMEFQYFHNSHLITFTMAQQRRPPSTVLALPAPPPMRRARREAILSLPCDIMNRANHLRRPNALDHVDADNFVLASLRQAIL